MTSIAIVRGDDVVVIASDGAAHDNESRLIFITSKQVLLPEASCVIVSRGSALAADHVRAQFFNGGEEITFDKIVLDAVGLAKDAHEAVLDRGAHYAEHFTLFLCGYSEERGRAETYLIRNRPTQLPTGEVGPFTLVPLPVIYLAPTPHEEAALAFDVELPANLGDFRWSAQDYAARMVCACRQSAGVNDDRGGCSVGAFVQCTSVGRDEIRSEIAHRWPDRRGEILDPKVGLPGPGMVWGPDGKPTWEG